MSDHSRPCARNRTDHLLSDGAKVMGSVFKKTVTRPVPPGSETIEKKGVRLARWRDSSGRAKTAPLTIGKDGAERIRDESGTYFARYRDGCNQVVEVPTGCRSEDAARQVLADLE